MVALLAAFAVTAYADARTDYLVRALRTSSMMRVRAQAAISLGAVRTEPQVISALTEALSDDQAAVRAAAASSLERHGDPAALPALQRATRDRELAVRNAAERAVRHLEALARSQPRTRTIPTSGGGSANTGGATPSRGPARFYVAVGTPGTKVRGISRETLAEARAFIAQTAQGTPGVQIAPEGERSNAAERVLRERELVGFYLDSSIVSLEERNGGLRAQVSVILQSYPDRSIRSMMNGAATVTGASGPSAQAQAIQGALRGALRNLPTAMEASAGSAQARAGRRR